MGEKDIAEKVLEDYNDVFADIVNVLLFQGEQIVKPEQLEDKTLRSSYKAAQILFFVTGFLVFAIQRL